MISIKRILAVLICCAILISTYMKIPVAGFGREKHDNYLRQVLFGTNMSFTTDKQDDNMNALENASFLCLDFTKDTSKSTAGHDAYTELKNYKVKGLPKDLSEIEFSSNARHRQYTHYGWDQGYKDDDDKANWSTRKNLLLATTNKVFDFGKLSGKLWFDYNDKCESFSALIYYVHIIGDAIYANDNSNKSKSTDTANDMIPLARRNPSEKNPSITYELEKHLKVIFSDQDESMYSPLIKKIEKIDRKARSALKNGEVKEDNLAVYSAYAEELMQALIDELPDLLKEEKFFIKAFPDAA